MTGYGSGRVAFGGGHLVADIRCVNHRYLDVRVRLPSRIQHLAPEVETVLRGKLERGRVDAAIRLEGRPFAQSTLDVERARQVLAEFAALGGDDDATKPVPLSVLGMVPDLFVQADTNEDAPLREALRNVASIACRAIEEMRRREGQTLRDEFVARLDEVSRIVGTIERALPQMRNTYEDRLRQRIATLVEKTGATVDDHRIAQEIAILAEKADVAEELSRLASHREQLFDLVQGSSPVVGKRIDFLLQELAREANTLSVKTSDAELTRTIIDLKGEIERMREQAQNVL